MLETYFFIRFVYPFLLLAVFFLLYRKQYRFMQRFYWRMTMLNNQRKIYLIFLLILLLGINYCFCAVDHNWGVGMSAFMTICFMSYKVGGRVLIRIHQNSKLLLATNLLAILCYAIPYVNSISIMLLTLGVASAFYPSERILRMKSSPEFNSEPGTRLSLIMKYYY